MADEKLAPTEWIPPRASTNGYEDPEGMRIGVPEFVVAVLLLASQIPQVGAHVLKEKIEKILHHEQH